MKMRWLVLAVIVIVPVCRGLYGSNRDLPLSAGPTLTVMSYNVGNYTLPIPTTPQIVSVIRHAAVPDLLLVQDNPSNVVIAQLAQQLRMPYHLSGRDTKPRVNASLLSRYPMSNARALLFDKNDASAGMICADVQVPAHTVQACSVYMQSISGLARQAVDERDNAYRGMIHLLWREIFSENQRSRSVLKLLDWLGTRASVRTIIGGDFNTFPQSRAIRAMSRHFHDVLWFTADNLTGTYIKLDFPLRPRIDYLFHSEDIEVEEAAVVPDTAGDHYPIIARMRLPSAEVSMLPP